MKDTYGYRQKKPIQHRNKKEKNCNNNSNLYQKNNKCVCTAYKKYLIRNSLNQTRACVFQSDTML